MCMCVCAVTKRFYQFHLWAIDNMFGLATRGFQRALITRCARTTSMTASSSAQAPASASTAAHDVSKVRPGEIELVPENVFFVYDTSSGESKTVGLRWRPGLWERCKTGDAETTEALKQRFKSGGFTLRDLARLAGFGVQFFGLFLLGSVLMDYRNWGGHAFHAWRGVEIEYFDAPDPDSDGRGHH